MKTFAFLAFVALAQSAETVMAEPLTSAQEQQQLISLATEIKAQQTLIAENQAKIDSRLAVVTEVVRVARIYSSRGGR